MSASAVHLDGREHLVDRLERLLKQAQTGVIKAIAYAVVNEDNTITTGWRINNRVDTTVIATGVHDLAFRIDFLRHSTGDEE